MRGLIYRVLVVLFFLALALLYQRIWQVYLVTIVRDAPTSIMGREGHD